MVVAQRYDEGDRRSCGRDTGKIALHKKGKQKDHVGHGRHYLRIVVVKSNDASLEFEEPYA